jgi:hypothetical protein
MPPWLRRSPKLPAVIAGTWLLGGLAACGGSGPAAPPVEDLGQLSVTADQSTCGSVTWSAEVFVNGASQGRQPLGPFNPILISLAPGQYSVSVQYTDGVRTFTSPPLATTIIAGQTTNRTLTCSGFSLTVTPPTQTAVQGGSASIQVQIVRQGSFADPVTVVVRDHQGNTRGGTTIPTGSSSASIPLPIPSNFPTGTNTWTATGSATGIPDANASFQVTVNAPAPGTTIRFCNLNSGRTFIWAAMSTNGGQTWTQAPVMPHPNGGQFYEFTASGNQVAGASVTTTSIPDDFTTEYYHGSAEELQMFGSNTCQPSLGQLTVPGTVSGLQTGESAIVSLGLRTRRNTPNGNFNWLSMLPGTYNVFASAISNATGSSRAIFLQRNVTVPLTTSPFAMNLTTGATPATANLNLSGLMSGDQVTLEPSLFMPQGPSSGTLGSDLFTASGTSTTRQIQGVPPSLLQSGDLHFLLGIAQHATGSRWYYGYSQTFGDMNVTLRTPITGVTPSCGSPGGVPVRVRVQGIVSADYDDFVETRSTQLLSGGGFRSSFGFFTRTGAAGVNIDVSTPTFAGANYTPLWGLQPNVAISGNLWGHGSNVDRGSLLFLPVNGLALYLAQERFAITCP